MINVTRTGSNTRNIKQVKEEARGRLIRIEELGKKGGRGGVFFVALEVVGEEEVGGGNRKIKESQTRNNTKGINMEREMQNRKS